MTPKLRLFTAALFAIALFTAAAPRRRSPSADQRGEIEKIIREYLLAHPELLQEVLGEMESARPPPISKNIAPP
jgi:hypothetical protein